MVEGRRLARVRKLCFVKCVGQLLATTVVSKEIEGFDRKWRGGEYILMNDDWSAVGEKKSEMGFYKMIKQ